MIETGEHSPRPAAALSLASKVHHLDQEAGMFTAMIAGWEDQQRARLLRPATIE